MPLCDPLRAGAEADKDGERSAAEDEATTGSRLEESYVRSSLTLSLGRDLLNSTHSSPSQAASLARQATELDKVLLQLLALECRQGAEERGMKALEIARLLGGRGSSERGGKMLEAAAKIADRYGHALLREKIVELAERRIVGEEDRDGAGEEEEV